MYSFSQLQTYKQCPLKYRYQYIDKVPKKIAPQSPYLLLGSAVHHALEMLYKKIQYRSHVSKESLFEWYSIYRNNEIDREQIVFPAEKFEQHFFERWKSYLVWYYEQYMPFSWAKILMNEWFLTFWLDESQNIKWRGVIDRLEMQDNMFIIHDYKTNTSLSSYNTHKEQMSLYALWVQQKYPSSSGKIVASLHYLHFAQQDTWTIAQRDIQAIQQSYITQVHTINQYRFAYNMWDMDAFVPKKTKACRFCSYKALCPAWQ